MASADTYTQVLLKEVLGDDAPYRRTYVAWIPTEFAKRRKHLLIENARWEVEDVWSTRDAEWVEGNVREHRKVPTSA